ncbi:MULTISPECIES: cytochrome c oxidase assembly protein [Paracoccus]|jgi:cytochrome c oxidase assembly protein subunit 11|uniref:Cytochrome c oxidase assembly protein CtaG n=1 Tax=Paracoccus litorisediminis TaxID=2006130 RepID=A0A844HKV8_9RHOB|nr:MULTISPECIES: cytochrome c oxidase assembly protein [Paracoccus]MBD9526798.1 cytochrome c oxidase assembly protein [Paracoccus sp. PAR01]MTH59699.1 cytochrome c oxidase assembly protein [Paracoccus litorisediminis]
MTQPRSNARIVGMLVGVVVVMGALSWAAVPFYDWFCRVTGYGGTTNVAAAASDVVLDEKVRVRFDSNVDPDMGWTFRPLQREMELRIGENAIAFYEAINTTDQPITGTASYNVAPEIAGYYFNKIECFCFTEQTLQPGERIEMPVSFFVDAGLVDDRDAGRVRDITLSYTFHRSEPAAPKQAALQVKTDTPIN